MRFWLAAMAAFVIAGCNEDSKPVNIKLEKPKGTGAPEIKSDPTGKYQCLGCNLKTNDTKCPKCGTVLKAEAKPKPATAPTTPKTGATVGKSTTSAVYACPECPFTDPRGGNCFTHTAGTLGEVEAGPAGAGADVEQARAGIEAQQVDQRVGLRGRGATETTAHGFCGREESSLNQKMPVPTWSLTMPD